MAYERKDIDQKYKWDLTAIYESEAVVTISGFTADITVDVQN